jgi:hypothetical protein
MGILDDYFIKRRRARGNGSFSPFTPRASDPSSREVELQAELDRLYRERAALVRAEAEGRQNLARLQDQLDILANEIDRRAKASRERDLAERGAATIANVRAWASRQDGVGRNTPRAVTKAIMYALGLERPPPGFAAVPPSSATAHQATAQDIVDAGNRARGSSTSVDVRTGAPKPLPSPITKLDPVARGIIRQGRLAKNEKLDD